MSNTNTGGPAFPVQSIYVEDEATNSRGMTLRDYFAAKAMQGLLSDSLVLGTPAEFSRRAYAMADAMLKERMH